MYINPFLCHFKSVVNTYLFREQFVSFLVVSRSSYLTVYISLSFINQQTSQTAPIHSRTYLLYNINIITQNWFLTLPPPSYTLSHMFLCPKKTNPSSLYLCDVIYNVSYFFIYFRRNFLSISIEELQRATASDSEMKRLLGD